MAHIGIVTTGLTGITNAGEELRRRLTAAGHRVTTAAPRPGADLQLPAIDERPELRKEATGVLLEEYRAEPFVRAMRAVGTDLLLIDVELYEYVMAAHAHGLSFVLLSQWYCHWRVAGIPYPLTDAVPGRGLSGSRAATWWTWERIRWQRRWLFAKRRWRSGGRDRRSLLLRTARETNFPSEYIGDSFWPGAFSYQQLPALLMVPRELEFPAPLPDRLHYVGPMVCEDRQEATAHDQRGEDAGAILAKARAAGRRVICCTVSTVSAANSDFLHRLARAIADRPDWCLLMGIGRSTPPADFGPVADHVHLFNYLPQLRILAAADLSINHGGIHTIHEALHFGVPMLIYSGKRSDQNGCAARMDYHGVGLMADKDRDQEADIRHKIERVLTEPAYRERVAVVRRQLDHYRTANVLERTVAAHLTTATV